MSVMSDSMVDVSWLTPPSQLPISKYTVYYRYVCVCVCMCVCVRACVCVVYMCVHTNDDMYVYFVMYVRICVCVHLCWKVIK